MWPYKNVLLAITGSISAYKALELISLLQKKGSTVRVILTDSAKQFVGPASIEGLTGHTALGSDYQTGSMMSHIHWGNWADVFLVAPATAQTINSLATGVGHGPLLSTFLAFPKEKKVVIAPAMNTKMLEHLTTQSSLELLQSQGVQILPTGSGSLACGEVGPGRLLEPAEIVQKLESKISISEKGAPKVLITAGGTREPIDGVRYIGNTSTGRTGKILAEQLLDKGCDVTLVTSKQAHPSQKVSSLLYETYDELYEIIKNELSHNDYSTVIHAAAVSDFRLKEKTTGKISSGQDLTLHLQPTEKIISKIKTWSRSPVQLVGFKLTNTTDQDRQFEAIDKVFSNGADLVVHNDMHTISENHHPYSLWQGQKLIQKSSSAQDLADSLYESLSLSQQNTFSIKEAPL